MRKLGVLFVAIWIVALSGCGCLEAWEDRNWAGGGGPDPDQSAWHKCLFGTRQLPRLYGPHSIPPQYIPPDDTQNETQPSN